MFLLKMGFIAITVNMVRMINMKKCDYCDGKGNILDWKYEALARKEIIIEHLHNKIFDLENTARLIENVDEKE